MNVASPLLIDDVAQAWPRTRAADGKTPARRRSWASLAKRTEAGFIDRESELELMLRSLGDPDGPHFWLVVAPPGLGKSKFLQFIRDGLETQSPDWEVRSADVDDMGEELANEPASLLAHFFSQELDEPAAEDAAEQVAEAILASGKWYLCLLDSADLLNEHAVAGLRKFFSEIYQRTGPRTADRGAGRVALVVASRLDSGWKSVTPGPRFRHLPLAAFTKDDVGEALRELATRMRKSYSPSEYEKITAWVNELSGGAPELLTSCLRWIEKGRWRHLDKIADDAMFRELGYPFVRDRLLTSASLLPLGLPGYSGDHRQAVEDSLRLIAPYRLFTRSHLRNYLTPGSQLCQRLTAIGWSLDDLWKALASSALVGRPQNEPWQTVQPTIRKLLFRYFYETEGLRTAAQLQALEFDRDWSQRQTGDNQVAGLAECIWHEASVAQASDPDQLEAKLMETAKKLVDTLTPEGSYTLAGLRRMLAGRLRDDTDLRDLLRGSTGAHERLIRTVKSA